MALAPQVFALSSSGSSPILLSQIPATLPYTVPPPAHSIRIADYYRLPYVVIRYTIAVADDAARVAVMLPTWNVDSIINQPAINGLFNYNAFFVPWYGNVVTGAFGAGWSRNGTFNSIRSDTRGAVEASLAPFQAQPNGAATPGVLTATVTVPIASWGLDFGSPPNVVHVTGAFGVNAASGDEGSLAPLRTCGTPQAGVPATGYGWLLDTATCGSGPSLVSLFNAPADITVDMVQTTPRDLFNGATVQSVKAELLGVYVSYKELNDKGVEVDPTAKSSGAAAAGPRCHARGAAVGGLATGAAVVSVVVLLAPLAMLLPAQHCAP